MIREGHGPGQKQGKHRQARDRSKSHPACCTYLFSYPNREAPGCVAALGRSRAVQTRWVRYPGSGALPSRTHPRVVWGGGVSPYRGAHRPPHEYPLPHSSCPTNSPSCRRFHNAPVWLKKPFPDHPTPPLPPFPLPGRCLYQDGGGAASRRSVALRPALAARETPCPPPPRAAVARCCPAARVSRFEPAAEDARSRRGEETPPHTPHTPLPSNHPPRPGKCYRGGGHTGARSPLHRQLRKRGGKRDFPGWRRGGGAGAFCPPPPPFCMGSRRPRGGGAPLLTPPPPAAQPFGRRTRRGG